MIAGASPKGSSVSITPLAKTALQLSERPNWAGTDREWRCARLARCRFALKITLRAREWRYSTSIAATAAVLAPEDQEAVFFLVQRPEYITASSSPKLLIDHVRRDYRPPWSGSRHAALAVMEALVGNIHEAQAWLRRALAELYAWFERDEKGDGPGLQEFTHIVAAMGCCRASGPCVK